MFPERLDGAFPLVPGSLKVGQTGWADMEVTESRVLLLPFAPPSVGAARRRLVSDLIAAGIYESAVCDVALVVSELFGNALRHAAPLPGAKIRVAWRLGQESVQVSVSDGGGPTRPELGDPAQGATGGRGLRIVEKLSNRWGANSGDEGTTVWAEVPVRQVKTEMTNGRRPGSGHRDRLAGQNVQEPLRMRPA